MVFVLSSASDLLSGSYELFMIEPGKRFPYSFAESFEHWHAAGASYHKLASCIFSFGRARKLLVTETPNTSYNSTETSFHPFGDQDDGLYTNPYCLADSQS